jgi:Rieske Fe-S protein
MKLNRRNFLILSATTALATGCANQPIKMQSASIDAGPESDYVNDGVYDKFRDQGFFVVRRGGQLYAMSSICTHMGCKVKEQPDMSYHCPCHGSSYDAEGKVTHGPAIHDLPRLPTNVDSNGHLMITALATV